MYRIYMVGALFFRPMREAGPTQRNATPAQRSAMRSAGRQEARGWDDAAESGERRKATRRGTSPSLRCAALTECESKCKRDGTRRAASSSPVTRRSFTNTYIYVAYNRHGVYIMLRYRLPTHYRKECICCTVHGAPKAGPPPAAPALRQQNGIYQPEGAYGVRSISTNNQARDTGFVVHRVLPSFLIKLNPFRHFI